MYKRGLMNKSLGSYQCSILKDTSKINNKLDCSTIPMMTCLAFVATTVGQRGFWDEQQRVTKLQDNKPVLKRLADSIPWESFPPLLEKAYEHEHKSKEGHKRIDPLTLS